MNKLLSGAIIGGILFFVPYNVYQMNSLANETSKMNESLEKVEIESLASSAKALYLPKKVCLIQVDESVAIPELRKYLASCLHSHQNWLELNSSKPVENKK